MPSVRDRFQLVRAHAPEEDLGQAVLAGLGSTPKTLPFRLLYDEEGSLLFEAICRTPEYYPTRAERSILEREAEWLAGEFAGHAVVELGSGSAEKTEVLLAALAARGPSRYVPIDICEEAIEASAARLLERYPDHSIEGIVAEYVEALDILFRRGGGPELVLWLGSNVGNFDRESAAAFLREVRARLGPRDAFLMGVDLRKERAVLEAAYDDAAGVTARFNKNLLGRVNRELGGEFDLDAFRHVAVWDEVAGKMDMYLVSGREQTVGVAALGRSFRFARGERIHTESSYKYSRREIDDLAAAGGFRVVRTWLDDGKRFALSLLAPVGA